MLKLNLCDHNDAYILAKGNMTVSKTTATGADANNTNKKLILQNCAPFTNCINEIINTKLDNATDTDIVIAMHSLIEYSDNYSEASGSLWKYSKDITAVNNKGNIVEFNGANATDLFSFISKITGPTDNNGRISNVEIILQLKYLSDFWRALEMPLISCEINIILTWSANCVIICTNVANQNPTFEITETKFYVPVITLSTQDNSKLLPQIKSGFKQAINWNEYLTKPELLIQNSNLNH